jgi:hypothetical protein
LVKNWGGNAVKLLFGFGFTDEPPVPEPVPQ